MARQRVVAVIEVEGHGARLDVNDVRDSVNFWLSDDNFPCELAVNDIASFGGRVIEIHEVECG